jgi:hypothetical protein
MKPKAQSSPRGAVARLRRRTLFLRGERVRFEQHWQGPQRIPTIKLAEQMEAALESDLQDLSLSAEKLWEQWRGAQDEFDPVARVLASFTNMPSRRLRFINLRLNGKRLRTDCPKRRMMAWRMHLGHIYIRLPSNKVDRILAAPGIPISYTGRSDLMLKEKLAGEDLARFEIDNLYQSLCASRIFPPKFKIARHVQRLLEVGQKFSDLLFDDDTDLMWRPEPAARLAHLRQEISDFLFEAELWRMCRRFYRQVDERGSDHETRQGYARQSAIEVFIDDELRPAYERIYSRACRIKRTQGGPPSGPFVAFASSFFEQVGFARLDIRGKKRPYPNSETIARAIKTGRSRR